MLLFEVAIHHMLLLLLLGCFAGLVAGLLGIGGGLIIVPALIIFFQKLGFSEDYLTQMAIATSLATIIFTSISSIRTHNKSGLIDWSLVKTLSVGLFFGAIFGAFFATALSGPLLQLVIGVFALLVALQMFFQFRPKQSTMPNKLGQYFSGVGIAFISAIFGIGGGTITVPTMIWFGLDMKKAVSVSAACGLPIAIFSVLGFLLAAQTRNDLPAGTIGFVYMPALVLITLTSTVAAHFGAILAHRLPAQRLKQVFSLLLLLVGIRFILSSL